MQKSKAPEWFQEFYKEFKDHINEFKEFKKEQLEFNKLILERLTAIENCPTIKKELEQIKTS